MIDRIAPTRRPDGRIAGRQKWRTLSFLHWRVPAAVLRPLVPARLTLDTFDGDCFVGVVPFTMRGVRPWWAPPVPGVSNFHETNVRTYVHLDERDPGVWFFSLDAANRLAVYLARTFWGLPYFHATMALVQDGDVVRYDSTRDGAALSAEVRIAGEAGPAAPGTLEHFLAERYFLYADKGGTLYTGQVHHGPYPLQRAEAVRVEQSLLAASNIAVSGAPIAHFATGVDVDVFPLAAV